MSDRRIRRLDQATTGPAFDDEGRMVLQLAADGMKVEGLHGTIAALNPILTEMWPSAFYIDLSRVEFCEPCGLAAVHCLLAEAVNRGVLGPGTTVLAPRNRSVFQYLRRMDCLDGVVKWSSDYPWNRHEPTSFVPVEIVTSLEGATQSARKLARAASHDATERRHLTTALVELLDNTCWHSNSAIGGVACAQKWSGGRIHLAIVDGGVGIPESLRGNPTYADADDAAALRLSVGRNVTGLSEDGRGQGLWEVGDIVAQNGGRLWIWSNHAFLHKAGNQTPTVRAARLPWPGTLVVVELWAGRPMKARTTGKGYEVSGAYDFVDGL